MATVLTQVSKREGRVNRVRRGDPPVVELHLEPGQYIAGFELDVSATSYMDVERKTVDWRWTAYIVTPLGES